MKTKNIWTDLTSIILLVFIFGGMVLHIVTPDRTFSDMENRNLASLPEFTWDKFISGQYTKDLETYMSDQFFWRDAWVGLQAASQQLLTAAIQGCTMSGVGDTTSNTVAIDYDAIVTPVSTAVTNTQVASVLFVISWDK